MIKETGNSFSCDCGFSWLRGQSGAHECGDGLRTIISELKQVATGYATNFQKAQDALKYAHLMINDQKERIADLEGKLQKEKPEPHQETIGGCAWIDWNQLSERGLIIRINKEILHPVGLAMFRDTATGISAGALIADDGKWVYSEDITNATSQTTTTRDLPPLNNDVTEILGRPNFTCIRLAQALRQMGHEIPRRSENEQAAVIYFLFAHYLRSGKNWKDSASAELEAVQDKKGGIK